MAVLLVLFKFDHCLGLPLRHIHALVHRLYELVFTKYKSLSSIICFDDPVGEEDCLFRAGFFTQAAEDAAQHIDLVHGSILLFAIQFLFTLLSFGGGHGDGFGGTSYGTKSAGCATFGSVVVAFQRVLTPPYGTYLTELLRIFYRCSLTEQVPDGDHDAAQHRRKINLLEEAHLFLHYNLGSVRQHLIYLVSINIPPVIKILITESGIKIFHPRFIN